MNMIQKVALAVFKDKKLLMVRSKKHKVFFSLGGKIEGSESDLECLKREVREEVRCRIDESSIKFLVELNDVAHGRKDSILNMRLYEGRLIGNPKPSSEIAEIAYFDTTVDKKYLSTFAQRTLLPWLKRYGYIN